MASIRPSWPPPRMPIVAPGWQHQSCGRLGHRMRSARAPGLQPLGERRSAVARMPRRAARRWSRRPRRSPACRPGCRRASARSRAGCPAPERLRLHRHAEHRQVRHRRDHARQVRRAARAGDDHLEALVGRALGEGDQPVGRAVRRDDPRLVGDAELVEHSAARCIVAQSDWLPMTIATRVRSCSALLQVVALARRAGRRRARRRSAGRSGSRAR